MTSPYEDAAPGRRSWLVFGGALVAGFIAAGTFATSLITAVILVLSLFIATFLVTLAHSILTDSHPPVGQVADSEAAPDSVRVESI